MAVLQVVVSVLPGARVLLGTTPLGMADLVAIGAGVVGPLIINEATKPAHRPEGDADGLAQLQQMAGDNQLQQEEPA
jgi:hypothetical protein